MRVLFAQRANAARHQDGVDQQVTTARLRAASLILEPVMLSTSHLPFHWGVWKKADSFSTDSKTPAGDDTSTIARTKVGAVPYC